MDLMVRRYYAPPVIISDLHVGSQVGVMLDAQRSSGSYSVTGFELARVFTLQPVSEQYVRQRQIPATSYGDMLPLPGTPREKELARLIASERPDVVLLLNWHPPLSPFFFEAMSIPTDLRDPQSLPVILRLTVTYAPTVVCPRTQEEQNVCQVAAIATRVYDYGQPEATINVYQSPPLDVTVDDALYHAVYSAQRWMAHAIIGAYGSGEVRAES